MKPNEIIEFLKVAADFAVLEIDQRGVVCYASPGVRGLFNKQEGEVEGTKLKVLVSPLADLVVEGYEPVQARGVLELMDDADIEKAGCEYLEYLAAQNQQGEKYETQIELDDEKKWIEIAMYKMMGDEGVTFAAIVENITKRKHQENEIKALNENLENRVEERTRQIKNVVISCGKQLEQINVTYQSMKEQQMEIIEQLEFNILQGLPDLSDELADKIHEITRQQMIKCMDLYTQDQITDQQFLMSIIALKELFDTSTSNENLKPGQLSGTSQDEVDDLLDSLGI